MGMLFTKWDMVWGVIKSRPALILCTALCVFWLLFSTTIRYIEPGEAGIEWRPLSGQMTLLDRAGWHLSPPWALVTIIDTKPQRLCLTSSAHAAPNCRLAQFDATRYREFIAVEGWSYYWFRNRLSFNYGHPETYRGFRDVMRGYTFSQHRYPFIHQLES
jgi:hypothetical protein